MTCCLNVCVPLDKEMPYKDLMNFVDICKCKAIIYSDTYSDVIEKFKENNKLSIEHYIPMSDLYYLTDLISDIIHKTDPSHHIVSF